MAKFKLKSGRCQLFVDQEKVQLAPGDIVECEPWEIPEGFKKSFEEIIPPGEVRATPEEPDAELPDNFEVAHKGGGKYNVINKDTGEPINTALLSRAEAYELAGIPDPKAEAAEAAEKGFTRALEGDEDMAGE